MKRGVALVVSLVGLAVIVSAAGLLVMFLLVGSGPSVPADATLAFRPGGELFEVPPADVLQLVSASDARTVRGHIEALRRAKADPRVRTVLVAPRPFASPFWAKIQELRDALIDFRGSGKSVIAFLESGGEREYYLASAADRVYLLPTATLDLTGVATYEVFLRGTLDWIGTYPDLLHVGDYKTAVNTFTERTFTPAHREMSVSLTADHYEELVRAIAEARTKPEAEVRALIDRGPFLADEALRHGLVDALAYEDELDDIDESLRGSGARLVEADEYAAAGWDAVGLRRRARIAVIHAVGTIASGRSGVDPVNGPVLGSDTIVEHIRQARADASIRAFVLRIDSPGGSSTASDVIWRELAITKQDGQRRPLVVSMSDLAASGGYYIATAGDVLVAQPGTLTGSIGIYTGKFVTGGSLEKAGANVEATSQGRHAEMYSPDRRFTDEERARVEAGLQAFYDHFVEKVAEARQTTPEKIDQVAQGRVWTGRQARQNGLVDELGGLMTAVRIAKQRAKIPLDEEVELVIYPPRRSLYEMLSDQLAQPTRGQALTSAEAIVTLLGPRERRALGALLAPSRLFRPGELLAHMPYVFLR
ncbi:MAG: signal peptide peptidase SppA [Acidobacteriota bacterium]